jgi:TPR repeat protein
MFTRKNIILMGALLSTSLATVNAVEDQGPAQLYEPTARLLNEETPDNQYLTGLMLLARDAPGTKTQAYRCLEAAGLRGHNGARYLAGGLWLEGCDDRPPNKAFAFEWFKQAADEGHNDSSFRAALLLTQGFPGQAVDDAQALRYCQLAANEGHEDARLLAGFLLINRNQPGDKTKALEYFIDTAKDGSIQINPRLLNTGDVSVLFNVGQLLLENNKQGSKTQAYKLFESAGNKGHTQSMYQAGLLRLQGFDKYPPNNALAYRCFKKAAEAGHNEARVLAAHLLKQGFQKQPPKAGELALKYYIQAADEGHQKAMYIAGILLLNSNQPGDKRKGMGYLQRIEGGVERAINELAPNDSETLNRLIESAKNLAQEEDDTISHFMAGWGLMLRDEPSDKQNAIKHLTSAANKGHTKSKGLVGLLFAEGFEGQPQDLKKALSYLMDAAEEGDEPSQFNVGLLLATGFEDQPCDLKKATDYFIAAAEQGLTQAMIELAKIHMGYYSLDSIDLPKAFFWLAKADALKDEIAKEYISLLEEAHSISPEVLEQLLQRTEVLRRRGISGFRPQENAQNEAGKEPSGADNLATPAPAQELNLKEAEEASISEVIKAEPQPPLNNDQSLAKASPAPHMKEEVQAKPHQKIKIRKPGVIATVRENLAQIFQLKKKIDTRKAEAAGLEPSLSLKKRVNQVREEERITEQSIIALFEDPFFQNDVQVYRTKSGLKLVYYIEGKKHVIATHNNHAKNMKKARAKSQYSDAFRNELEDVLGKFGL